ncbi:TetR/AcrR family transcriptional regulator [Kutzneria sp. NPDC052558]|uniref:TetR/AcrR family transcriptional regulator n=1 Tax=Kutzneria sp. NPDC052558 TaxID=3364121 RepID=UPI0037C82A66
MPRVSQEHLHARRQQILDAAATCFARNGFHPTTMPDIFAEAGLSAGAVYRYFPGKHALIEALADTALHRVVGALRKAVDAQPPPRAAEIIDLIHRELAETDNTAPLIIQIWAEAASNPDIRSGYRKATAALHEAVTALVTRLHPDSRPALVSGMAWAILALSTGVFLCETQQPDTMPPTESLVDSLRAVLAD